MALSLNPRSNFLRILAGDSPAVKVRSKRKRQWNSRIANDGLHSAQLLRALGLPAFCSVPPVTTRSPVRSHTFRVPLHEDYEDSDSLWQPVPIRMEMDVDQQQIPTVKLSRIWDGFKRLLSKIENPVLITLLATLLLRLLSLPGAISGIAYFIGPDWNKLSESATWYANANQFLASTAVGLGSIVLFSGYSPLKRNIFRDAIIISLMNLSATFLTSLAIFSVVGNLAFETGHNVSDVVDGGRSFTFASHSDVVAKFTFVPRLVAVLFFLMMFALNISGAVTAVGGVVTALYGGFPSWKRWMLTTIASLVGFVAGLVYVTPSNLFILHVADYAGDGFVGLLVMAFHVTVICCFNGSFSWTEVRRFLFHSSTSD